MDFNFFFSLKKMSCTLNYLDPKAYRWFSFMTMCHRPHMSKPCSCIGVPGKNSAIYIFLPAWQPHNNPILKPVSRVSVL